MLLLLLPVHSGIFHSQSEQRLALLCLPRRDSCSLRFDYDAAAAGDDVGHSIADVGVVVVYLLRQRFSGFQFFSFFSSCAHEKCASLSYASGISSVSHLVCPSALLPLLRKRRRWMCCVAVLEWPKKMAQRRIRLRHRIRSHLVIFHALKSRLPSVSRERFSTLVKVIIGSCLAHSHSLSLPLALTQQVEQRAHSRARLRLLSWAWLHAVLIAYRNRFQCLQLAISDITGNCRAPLPSPAAPSCGDSILFILCRCNW